MYTEHRGDCTSWLRGCGPSVEQAHLLVWLRSWYDPGTFVVLVLVVSNLSSLVLRIRCQRHFVAPVLYHLLTPMLSWILHTSYMQRLKSWCWFEITIHPCLAVKCCLPIVIVLKIYLVGEEISLLVLCLYIFIREQCFWVSQGLVSSSVSMLHFAGIQPADGCNTLELFKSFHFFFQ